MITTLQGAAALNVSQSISLLTAFVQGILSFFSPCVLPLVPVYLTYLAGGTLDASRRRMILHTVCFVLGISSAIMLLGMTFTALGQLLRQWQTVVNLICGLLVIAFGLLQLGLIGQHSFLQRDYRLPFRLDRLPMNPLTALVMGICFSFSWTPCIGPTLSGIIMTAAASSTSERGALLMACYILGFVIPFLAVGFFTQAVLAFFKKHRSVVRWTRTVSAILLIVMGVLIMTGTMGDWSRLVASASAEEAAGEAQETMPDFTLTDQYGQEHTLSDYRGKVVFMNFWTTWCPWCVKEMPDIEEIYREAGENQGDVIILGMAAPSTVDTADQEAIQAFLSDNGFTYPVLMDLTGEWFNFYGVTSLPTTWLLKPDGTILGYVAGALSKEQMLEIIDMAKQ